MFFQCVGGDDFLTCSTEAFDVGLNVSSLRSFSNDRVLFSQTRFVSMAPEMVWNNLRQYTGRSLTFDADILDAFTGVLNMMSSFAEDFDHIFGLPVYQRPLNITTDSGIEYFSKKKVRQTYAEQLVSSLVWKETGERRHGFPTWSWTGSESVIESDDFDIRNLDLDIEIETEEQQKTPVDEYFTKPVGGRPKVKTGLSIDAPVTHIELEEPMTRNGWYITVTSFDRNDGLKLRHGLRALRSWPDALRPGIYVAIVLGASQKTRTSRLMYHVLVLKKKNEHYERAFVLQCTDADLENGVPKEGWAEWKEALLELLCPASFPWCYADCPADFGFREEARKDWEKVFLLSKHLRVERRITVLVR